MVEVPGDVKKDVQVAGHGTSALLKSLEAFLGGLESESPTGSPLAIAKAIASGISSAAEAGVTFLAPTNPIKNEVVSIISDVTAGASVAAALMFSGPAQSKFGAVGSAFKGLASNDGRATGAIVDAVLVLPALFVTGWHLYELSQLKAEASNRTADILGEVAKLASYVARVSYAVAVNDQEETSKQVFVFILIGSNLAVSAVQTAQTSRIAKEKPEEAQIEDKQEA